jgi:hypothetical protein
LTATNFVKSSKLQLVNNSQQTFEEIVMNRHSTDGSKAQQDHCSDVSQGEPVTSKRRLLKQATLAAPAILTLRSGAAMAMTSCERVNRRIEIIKQKEATACVLEDITELQLDEETGEYVSVVIGQKYIDPDGCAAAVASIQQAEASLGSHYCISQ